MEWKGGEDWRKDWALETTPGMTNPSSGFKQRVEKTAAGEEEEELIFQDFFDQKKKKKNISRLLKIN